MTEIPEGKAAVQMGLADLAAEMYDELMVVRYLLDEYLRDSGPAVVSMRVAVALIGGLTGAAILAHPELAERTPVIVERLDAISARMVERYGVTDPEVLKAGLADRARRLMGAHAN